MLSLKKKTGFTLLILIIALLGVFFFFKAKQSEVLKIKEEESFKPILEIEDVDLNSFKDNRVTKEESVINKKLSGAKVETVNKDKGIEFKEVSINFFEILKDQERVENDLKSPFNKTYKKVYELELFKDSEARIKLKLGGDIKDVISVLLVGREGVLSPSHFSLNNGQVNKNFKTGQDLFKNDWVKLSNETGLLRDVSFSVKGRKELNMIEVYVQKLK